MKINKIIEDNVSIKVFPIDEEEAKNMLDRALVSQQAEIKKMIEGKKKERERILTDEKENTVDIHKIDSTDVLSDIIKEL